MPKRPQLSKLTQGKRDRVSTPGFFVATTPPRPMGNSPVLVICPRVMFTLPSSARVDYRIPLRGPVTALLAVWSSVCIIMKSWIFILFCHVIITTIIIYFVVQALATGSSYVF